MQMFPLLEPGSLVDRFCTPPHQSETEYDRKALADAESVELSFEGHRLTGYLWGTGKHVLLLHGWGSRVSHLTPLGRILVKSGFRVIAFDAPAHGASLKRGELQRSSMFEYCRALSTVAHAMGPVYAIVGHSLGAASGVFTVAGYAGLSNYRVSAERLVSICAPASLTRMITRFCQNNNLDEATTPELTQQLERAFGFSVTDYSVPLALKQVDARVLLVHDEDDEEIPLSDAFHLKHARDDAKLVLTRGAGHQRILANRAMIRAVKDFLVE